MRQHGTWPAATGTVTAGQYSNIGTVSARDFSGTVATPVTASDGDRYFGVRKNQEMLLFQSFHDDAGNLLGLERAGREKSCAVSFGGGQHPGFHALRA